MNEPEGVEPTRVLLVGAGGHARVCVDALRDDLSVEVVGCITRDGRAASGLGVQVLGTDDELDRVVHESGVNAAFVAIGDNAGRLRWCAAVRRSGLRLVNAVSLFAVISPSVLLGEGVAVMAGAVVNAATRLADGVIVNSNASVDHDCLLGAGVHIGPGAAICGGVRIGPGTLIGVGASVIPGIAIGAEAIVGAGAVVIADVPDGATVVGNPARRVRPRRE